MKNHPKKRQPQHQTNNSNNWMLRLRNINDYNYTDDKCIDDKNRICFLLSS